MRKIQNRQHKNIIALVSKSYKFSLIKYLKTNCVKLISLKGNERLTQHLPTANV